MPDIGQFKLQPADFGSFGHELVRPECVWIDHEGVWVSDGRGGVAQVLKDGPPQLRGSGIAETNGISRRRDGSFVAAGLADGKAYRIDPDGTTTVILDAIDGRALGSVNCVWADGDRTWISMMTTSLPWHLSMNEPPLGYVILIDDSGARIVADRLSQTNEIKVSPDGRHLYAVETLARRIVRFPILASGDLGPKEFVGPDDLGHGCYPDGFTIDVEGNIWLTLVCRNGIGVISANGEFHTVFEEPNIEAVDALVEAAAARVATLAELGACMGGCLPFPTSLAFGGEDGRTVFVGSLVTDRLATFRAPVTGVSQWRSSVG